MSYGLRTFLESLILGNSGSTYLIASGRFHLKSPDRTLEDHPANAVERAIEVIVNSGKPAPGFQVNALDLKRLVQHTVKVRVGYALTNAGGDLTDAIGEQDGAGTLDAVRDRANADSADITNVLQWPENWVGGDPDVVNVQLPDDEIGEPAIASSGVAILTIPLTVTAWVTVPAAEPPSHYAP